MKKLIMLAWALLLAILVPACNPGGGKGNTPAGKPVKIPNVSVEVVSGRDMTENIVIFGQIAPDHEVVISAEAGGLAEKVVPEKGDSVKKGDVLAEIDRRQLKAALDRAEAALRQSRLAREDADLAVRRTASQVEITASQVTQAGLALKQAESAREKVQVTLDNQRKHFERVQALYREKLAPQSAFDDAQSSLRSLEADEAASRNGMEAARQAVGIAEGNLAAMKLQMDSARLAVQTAEAGITAQEAALAEAKLSYDKGLITAPFDALVDDIRVDEGEFVKAESVVMKLISIDPVKVKLSLAEKDVPFIKTGEKARISIGSLPGSVFEGKVTFVALSADESTNTYPAEVMVPNPGGRLRAGMVAQVTMVRRRVPGAVAVPTFAVIPKEDGDVVFVLENGKAVRRKVTTGILENGWVQIVEGLAPGEQLIVKGQRDLQDGQEVRVQP